jgi:5'-nucleotidase
MAIDLSNILVVGVSTRALFDLEKENEVYDNQGIEAFRKYQLENEDKILQPGTAFYLVKSLLELNKIANKQIVEVVVMSKNSAETGFRVLNSIEQHNLGITRVAFTGGEPLSPYINAFYVDLFLSKYMKDVQTVIDNKDCAAALLYAPPTFFNPIDPRVKIAFDADAVVFSEESEFRFKTEGMTPFHEYEKEHENDALAEGPFAKLIIKLSKIQEYLPTPIENSPLRLAIVTARNAPSHKRVIKTLRKWGVYVDEVYFLGGWPKDKVLEAFGAHIFFDDQDTHLKSTSILVPSAKVPYETDSPLDKFLKQ